jgi:hypothetical protein
MSAAANAAGYLYAHGQLPMGDLNAPVKPARSHSAAKSESSRRLEPQPLKQPRTPRIEYRKRRFYPLPSASA